MSDFSPVIAAAVAFIVTAALGLPALPMLKRLKFGQTILEDGPKWHSSKQGTPTMGGIIMVAGVLLSFSITYAFSAIAQTAFANERMTYRFSVTLAGVALAVAMGIVGFMDDYIKVVKKRNLGLTAKQKTFLQLLVTVAYLVTLYLIGVRTTWIPFVGEISVVSGAGILFWIIALFFVYGFVNAVNLTDGIDGLASSVTLVVCCVFMLITGLTGMASANTASAAFAGACVGFLVWNIHPAKMFMGDTGSLFLGGAVVGLGFSSGKPILLILVGIVYLIEALSVMIQVSYFKKTKKRIFKMTPIHHHFEMCGWKEEKIVFVFSAVTLALGAIAVLIVAL
ncbi:MAG: phospho-N-acetylmuramoyl-pentapeptide-transferase [Clostridia bacterium]|nr:phospho-N-acetylmuramoyl-pentapeptide-transferase [Oscillospiraceae bacterium]MBR6693847.1 phospho-N-acetylmuramoyl-pentapeptide-transferase [Clostridia bacterium]